MNDKNLNIIKKQLEKLDEITFETRDLWWNWHSTTLIALAIGVGENSFAVKEFSKLEFGDIYVTNTMSPLVNIYSTTALLNRQKGLARGILLYYIENN